MAQKPQVSKKISQSLEYLTRVRLELLIRAKKRNLSGGHCDPKSDSYTSKFYYGNNGLYFQCQILKKFSLLIYN